MLPTDNFALSPSNVQTHHRHVFDIKDASRQKSRRRRRKDVRLMLTLNLTSPSWFAPRAKQTYRGYEKKTKLWRSSSLSFVISFVSCHFCSGNFQRLRTSPPTAVQRRRFKLRCCLVFFVHSSLAGANFTVGPHTAFSPGSAFTCRFHYYSG